MNVFDAVAISRSLIQGMDIILGQITKLKFFLECNDFKLIGLMAKARLLSFSLNIFRRALEMIFQRLNASIICLFPFALWNVLTLKQAHSIKLLPPCLTIHFSLFI